MKSSQLLCTFSNSLSYKDTLKKISESYTDTLKFFIFENKLDNSNVYLTYNINIIGGMKKFESTISIHRKKFYNTLYSLNAMNRLIAEENGGVFDKNFKLDWELYKDCLILTGDVSVKIINIQLVDIVGNSR